MPLAERIWWFYRDNGEVPPQVDQLGTVEFLNEVAEDLFDIILKCQHSLKHFSNPQDLVGFAQEVYDDYVNLHNKAVDIYNDLMEYGLLR